MQFEQLLGLPDCGGLLWTVLDCAGLYWTADCVLDCAGLCWTVLDRLAQVSRTLNANFDYAFACAQQVRLGLKWYQAFYF